MKTASKKQKKIIFITFIIYLLIVLRLTVFRVGVCYAERQYNFAFFSDLIYIYRNMGISHFLRLFLGNIGWFIPFGFILPLLWKRISFLKTVFMGFLFSLTIEFMQFAFYKGVAEVDDLILNTFGVAIGYLLNKWLSGFVARIRS